MSLPAEVIAKIPTTLKLGGEQIVVRHLVIKDYLAIWERIVKVIQYVIKEGGDLDTENLTPEDLDLLGPVLEDLFEIFDSLIEKDKGFIINNLDPADFLLLITSFGKMNKWDVIKRNFKLAKIMWNRGSKPKQK